MLALAAYRGQLCEHGHHPDAANDNDLFWTFENNRCQLCAGTAKYLRVLEESDQQAMKLLGENLPAKVPRPSDGRAVYLRLMSRSELDG